MTKPTSTTTWLSAVLIYYHCGSFRAKTTTKTSRVLQARTRMSKPTTWSLRHTSRVSREVMLIHIGKAHLYAPMNEEAFVDLPKEFHRDGCCGKLNFTLYGVRMGASNWEKEYSNTLKEKGFEQGVANTCTFVHAGRDVRIVVHGDDFVIEGKEDDLRWVHGILKDRCIAKVRALPGPDIRDDKEATILNRSVRWDASCLTFAADPKHAQQIVRDLGLETCNGTKTPGLKQRLDGRDRGGVVAMGNIQIQVDCCKNEQLVH